MLKMGKCGALVMPKNDTAIIVDANMHLKNSGRIVNELSAGKDIISSAKADTYALNTSDGGTENPIHRLNKTVE